MLHSALREESDYVGLNKTPASKSFLSWMMDDEQEERGGRGRKGGKQDNGDETRGESMENRKQKQDRKQEGSKQMYKARDNGKPTLERQKSERTQARLSEV